MRRCVSLLQCEPYRQSVKVLAALTDIKWYACGLENTMPGEGKHNMTGTGKGTEQPSSLRDALDVLRRRDAEALAEEQALELTAQQRVRDRTPPTIINEPDSYHSTAIQSSQAGITSTQPRGTPIAPVANGHQFAHQAENGRAQRHDRPTSVARHGGQQDAMTQPKTQFARGAKRPTRTDYFQEPAVGWLVVIGGPGLGAFRPVFEGNNAIGRAQTQRVPIDFGDDTISAEDQAFIRYDAVDREFLFVPNMVKTNVVSINETKPTAAVKLEPMDVITMGRTQLVFVPFCGEEFDWSELADLEQ